MNSDQLVNNIVNNLNILRQNFPNGMSSSCENQHVTFSPNYFDYKENQICQRQNICLETTITGKSMCFKDLNHEQKYNYQYSLEEDKMKIIPKEALLAITEHLSNRVYKDIPSTENEKNPKYAYLSFRSEISQILMASKQNFVNYGSCSTNRTHTFY